MNRPQGTILTPGSAYGLGANAAMVSLAQGGQMGWSIDQAAFVSNQAYIRQHLIPVLLDSPKIFNYMPNGADMTAALRGLIENQWLSIDGLNAGWSNQFSENPFGGSGLKQQDLVNVTEVESRPKHTYLERVGRPIKRFLRLWSTYAGMDPSTKFPLISTLSTAANIPDLLADMTTATVMYIEPDMMGRKVQQAWIVFNMFPDGQFDVLGSADKTQDKQTDQFDVQFTGIHQYGPGVDVFAQKYLDSVSKIGANPFLKQAVVQEISADVAAAQQTGYAAGVQSLASKSIRV